MSEFTHIEQTSRQTGKPEPAATTNDPTSGSDGTLVVKLPGPRLSVDRLETELSAVRREPRAARYGVRVDFSDVVELASPWTVHLALLVYVARLLDGRVWLCGLHGQPFEVAWFYRRHPEIRALLGSPEANLDQAA
jgi:hypothetical protein